MERFVLSSRFPSSAPVCAQTSEGLGSYRIEELFRALDVAGELQTTLRGVPAPQIAIMGDEVRAQIEGLDRDPIHSFRVTALTPKGEVLWESPLVVLDSPRQPSRRTQTWLLILGVALIALLVQRRRANRASA